MNTLNQNKTVKQRKQRGASLAELPLMLWMMFGLMLMPMLALATISLKSALMHAVVQDGVHAAAKAKTFELGTADKPSATTLAKQVILDAAAKFSGLQIDAITTEIVITPVTGGAVTRTTAKLTAPADTSKNIYQIETIAKGKIQPLMPLNARIIGSVPGMSAPILISYTARQMVENPQGLNK